MTDPFTPEQRATLARFADHYASGHKVLVVLARAVAALGALAMFIATLLYFTTETWKNIGPK